MTENISEEPKDNIKEQKQLVQSNNSKVSTFQKYYGLSVTIGVISILTILFIAAEECRECFKNAEDNSDPKAGFKKFWAHGKNIESGFLTEVFTVLDRFGYKRVSNTTNDWDLLWSHSYPFRVLYPHLSDLKPHQKVNHFPGCGYITNKVDLATSGLKYIPPAFRLPTDKDKLLDYVNNHPNKSFVQKHNEHRHVKIVKVDAIDFDLKNNFIQEYIDKPLTINGHRFDIGIYTVITSIDPLRVYIYNGEALLRFCPEKYYPFDPAILDKYVVGDDYLPIWNVPDLDYYYNTLGLSMKETLNVYLREKGQDPAVIWTQIEDAIRIAILSKEPLMLDILKKYKSKRNFFEMMRFDFVIDEDLNIYLLEANMSPNLSSSHFPPNRLMYQQVLYNILGLVGVGEMIQRNSLESRGASEENMIVSDKSIATFPEKCSSVLCKSGCASPECQLCKPCLSPDTRSSLIQAYREHLHKGDTKRVFPPTMDKEEALQPIDDEIYSAENQLQYRWFQGMCLRDSSWC